MALIRDWMSVRHLHVLHWEMLIDRQIMAFLHPIKPEGVSEFTIWLSMCITFVKFTLLISFLSFFTLFFSVLPCHQQSSHPSSCSNRNLHFSQGCFSPFCFCLPTVANNSSFLVSIAIRQQKHSALKNRQTLVAASHFLSFSFLCSSFYLPSPLQKSVDGLTFIHCNGPRRRKQQHMDQFPKLLNWIKN